ncbi:alpha/beta fold hydrolase [Williamsia soli]|uniref:alpha/beta fold hydrolase n=1 Tax=Williamsia soli TaxID=364929 RepID=UPI001A9F4436|nr:alpha/beta hydrolase [Williamsia soli]
MEILTRTAGSEEIALAVRTSGPAAANPVLLVHGMGGDHHTWRPLARALRTAGRTVISYDQRGHGRSSRSPSYLLNDFRDDLSFVLDGLGVEQVDVVGHSLGGQTALRMAMSTPERIGKLVLEEIPPMPRTQADLDENIAPFTGMADRMRGLWSVARYPGPVLRFDHRMSDVVTRQFDAVDTAWWDALSLITFPTLVISGGDRSFLPPRHLQSLTDALPSGDYFQIDAGHSVHRDRSDEFNRRVLDFLRL